MSRLLVKSRFVAPGITRCTGIALWLAGCLFSITGCGGIDAPETVPVSGTVTYKGTPLTNGKVRFNPVDSKDGRPAEGSIGSDGAFTLSTYKDGDGARPGEYNVTVVSYTGESGGLDKDKALGLSISDKSAIPEKYNDPATSGLKETVESGKVRTDVKLELKDE
ncbi:MAG: hypothetical protein WEB58_01385 [Planctomycetaceae bacterium]